MRNETSTRGVAVGVAVDVPLEAEIDQRRVLDDELAGRHLEVIWCGFDTDGAAGGSDGDETRESPAGRHHFVAVSGPNFSFLMSLAGFRSKKLCGRSLNECQIVGITGRSSARVRWCIPMFTHMTMS